ncbi:beta-ketoacyl synthase N-terminal-like domain-containing protein [Archangium violaceum]|uniref:beta-ketoacyl synthase N-terminal-like domain-containing protein n=1 Tax=Archangium violaceum TaxID=83451 RepID=UPI002B2F9190|nr:beta-ketoacyl synthase N-terminal-like domain-containing protein [Archangium gephyra]
MSNGQAADPHELLRQSLVELRKLRARLQEAQRPPAPVAVVGMSCRLPGADDPDSFWRLLLEGRDATRDVPPARWDADAWADRWSTVRRGGFLDDVASFDPFAFGLSPREAAAMDPQQRLLLECTWHALERAGFAPDELRRARVGVFIGLATDDYAQLVAQAGIGVAGDAHSSLGTMRSIAAGRISYSFGFQGPSLVLDTACSSSLVAVHLARASLRAGECDLAIAGGVNLMLSPQPFVSLGRMGMLAPDGRCKAFDAAADGMARGEGSGLLVLQRLDDARAQGRPLLALLRGSAVNQDGPSSGLTVPNQRAQEAVIRAALADAGLTARDIDLLEAHGTGTSLGDPLELAALAEVLAGRHLRDVPLLLGSVKTNFGHLEAAAGVTGLIKAILAVHHGRVPPHLHFREPNPYASWDRLAVEIPTEAREWPGTPDAARPRRAAVSSFGISGTNAHLIVESVPPAPATPVPDAGPFLISLRARTEAALDAMAEDLAAHLDAHPALSLADVERTTNEGRAALERGRCFVVGDPREAVAQLRASARGETPVWGSRERRLEGGGVVLAFPGQGSLRPGAGRALFSSEPCFRAAIERCEALLGDALPRPVRALLFDDDPADRALLGSTAIAQPLTFVVEYALAQLWLDAGVRPVALVGHSLGEYVAACIAGVFSLEEGLALVSARGRAMRDRCPPGGMLAVELEAERAVAWAREHGFPLHVAAINGPDRVVLAGAPGPLAEAERAAREQGLRVHRLPVDRAFHTADMEPVLDVLSERLAGMSLRAPTLPLWSALDARPLGDRATDPGYWRAHTREPVRFGATLAALAEHSCFIEAGVGTTMCALGLATLGDEGRRFIPSLPGRPGEDERRAWLGALGRVQLLGLARRSARQGARMVALPTLRFDRRTCWLPAPGTFARPPEPAQALAEQRWSPVAAPRRTSPMPVPSALIPGLRTILEPRMADPALRNYWTVLSSLEELTCTAVVRAFAELGLVLRPGLRFSPPAEAERLRVVAGQRRLFAHLVTILDEAGILVPAGGERVVAELVPAAVGLDAALDALLADRPDAHAEITVLRRCAAQLAAVLRGDVEPLQALFPGGDLSLATSLYRDAPFARVMNATTAAAVGAVVGAIEPSAPLRILEIGAGTGGTTEHVLPLLDPGRPGGLHYVFSDVGTAFLTHARQRHADRPFVEVRRFDVEQPPRDQGFAPASFDLILAANVIHATADLRATLGHVLELLAPGGMLLMLETTARQRWVDLFAGFTGGWWRFTDRELRPDHPLLSTERWLTLLGENGFVDADALMPSHGAAPGADAAPVIAKPALILARKGAAEETVAAPTSRGRTLLLGGGIDDPGLERCQDVDEALRTLARARAEGRPFSHLVHARGLAVPSDRCATLDGLAALGHDELVGTIRALGDGASGRLWILTRGLRRLGSRHVLWSLVTALTTERPPGWGGVIDTDAPELHARDLLDALAWLPTGSVAHLERGTIRVYEGDRPASAASAESPRSTDERVAAVPEQGADFAARLATLEAAARPALLRSTVEAVIRSVLGFAPGDPLDPDRGFFELGVDSLTAIALREKLQQALGMKLAASLVFDHPSPRALEDYLAGALGLPDAERASARADGDLDAALDAEVAALEALLGT